MSTPQPIILGDRGVPLVDDPVLGRRPATTEEVQAAARARVEALLAIPKPPRSRSRRKQPAAVAERPVVHPRPVPRYIPPPPPPPPWDAAPPTRVPEGRYAVEIDGTLLFFRVFTDGTVKAQHSRTFYEIATDRQERAAQAITVDRHAALIRYGRELGFCGVCGLEITNAVSRAEGIGPVCGGRVTAAEAVR